MCLSLLLAAAAMPAATSAPDLLPGRWRQQTRFSVDAIDGKRPADAMRRTRDSDDTSCYAAGETRSVARFLRLGMGAACPDMTVTADRGRLTISGTCRVENGSIAVSGQGYYTSADYDLTVHGTGTVNGHHIATTDHAVGHWLGTCAVDDPARR